MTLRTVRSKIFVGMGTVIVGFVLLSLLVLSHLIDRLAKVEIGQNLRHGESALGQFLKLRQRLLKDKAASLAETPYLKASLQTEPPHKRTVQGSTKDVHEAAEAPLLLVIDPHGRLLADASDFTRGGEDFRAFRGLEGALRGEEGGGIWSYRDRLYLVGVAPIISGEQLVGALAIGDRLDASLAADVRGFTGRDVIFLSGDRVLAASWAEEPTHPVTPEELAHLAGVPDRAGLRVQLGGKERLALSIPTENAQCRIVLSRSIEEILGVYWTTWTWVLGLGAATAGLAVGVSQLFSRRLSRRIQELMAASNAMAGGDLSVSVREEGADEIARLAASFNAMVRRIKELVESVRQAAERAEEANRLKTSFLANMSHEIRTPMNAILGYAYLLRDRLDVDEEAREDLACIERSGSHLLTLINDILDISKIESEQLQVERIPCSPSAILDDVLLVMAPPAREKGIEVSAVCDALVPKEILSDPTRIRQALINLIGNAVKFTEKGSVKVRLRSDGPEGGPWRIEFRIQDTGIGIPEDKIGQLFKPFMQVDPSATRKYGGTGLGLSISYRLAQLLGGDLAFERTPNAGSVFTLSIRGEAPSSPSRPEEPARSAGVDNKRSVEAAPPAVVRGRILVVEDSEESRALLRRMLEAGGASVEVAGDGAVALQRCSLVRFDLVLMDLQMPVMNGFQALAGLHRIGVQSPVVALTAHAMKGDRERCLEAGFSAYLPKPVTAPDLLTTVSSLLEKERLRVAALASRHSTP